MEVHLAVRQRADELSVLADVGNEHRELGMIDLCSFVASIGRASAFLQHAEMPGEADLLVLGELLVPEHKNEMLVPGVENVGDCPRLPRLEPPEPGTSSRPGQRER